MLKPLHQLTLIRNRQRVRELWQFRDMVDAWFARSERDEHDMPVDWEGAQAVRSRINQALPRILQIVQAAGIGRSLRIDTHTDPGLRIGRIDVLERIFSASYSNGLDQEIFDVIDMALGMYEADRFGAAMRTVNPLHYAGALLGFIGRVPRRFVRALGFGRGSRVASLSPADLARLEMVAARLADAEDLIDSRLATALDRQAQRHADYSRQLGELADRLDFAERLLAGQPTPPRVSPPRQGGMITPV